MKKLVAENTSGPIVSTSILQEFTQFHIDQVLNNCEKLITLEGLHLFVEVWRREHSRAILHAISEVFADVASTELEAVKMKWNLTSLTRNGQAYAMILNCAIYCARVT